MPALTATVAEARANFSKIAHGVIATNRPVTVLRNSKPWVVISPADTSSEAEIPLIDWNKVDITKIDEGLGYSVLPEAADYAGDEGLYDDYVKI